MKTENEESDNQDKQNSESFVNILTEEARECDKSSEDDQMQEDQENSSSKELTQKEEGDSQ